MTEPFPWLEIHEGDVPLIVSFPHTGIDIPKDIEARLVSPWLARKDADWWVERLYDFAGGLGATTIRTKISRTVIDVNRDPSGASLYPGQATTGLCPTETFDGEALYVGARPDQVEIDARREQYFEPYHQALAAQITRLRSLHRDIVLYEAHSIRSEIPRLFDGILPDLNIGTNGGVSCDLGLVRSVEAICQASPFSHIVNGRFKGGWTTRHYGDPANGIHAVQMELACASYMKQPPLASAENWPSPYEGDNATSMRATLSAILTECIAFASDWRTAREPR